MAKRNIDRNSRDNVEAEIGLFEAIKELYLPLLQEAGILDRAKEASKARQKKLSQIVRSSRSTTDSGITNEYLDAALIMVPLVHGAHRSEDVVEVPAIEFTGKKISSKGKPRETRIVVPMQEFNDYGGLVPAYDFSHSDVNLADEIHSGIYEAQSMGLLPHISHDLGSIEVPRDIRP